MFLNSIAIITLTTSVLLTVPSHALSVGPVCKFQNRMTQRYQEEVVYCRRSVLNTLIAIPATTLLNTPCLAANLPKYTGADLSKTGTVDSLISVVRIEQTLTDARSVLDGAARTEVLSPSQAKSISSIIAKDVPRDEIRFKRIFDEYSDPVSYKQKFMDQNAFLVYYTKGYDGPNRPSLESDLNQSRQTLQYGARNDAWEALDELYAELEYALKENGEIGDIIDPMEKAIGAVRNYLRLAPTADLQEAKSRILRSS